ncbi:MAG: TonB-dependent receptor, partial [Lentisphaeraceae bacterium]|nr:TonB-dependent receptor [Lentisphaeraceae bacterium]
YGIEAAINWQATERWRLRSSYTLFRDDLDGPQDFRNGSAPKNAFNLHSHYSLLDNLSLHANAYYKDNMVFYNISHYTRVDAGVIWEIREGMEFSVWGQNLLEPSHLESESSNDLFDTGNSFIGRSFFAQFTYKF